MSGGPDGVEFRLVDVTRPADLAIAYRIVAECERAAVGSSEATLESVKAQLTSPEVPADQRVFAIVDGEPSGLLVLEVDSHGHEVFVDAFTVGPSAATVLAALVSRGLAEARSIARSEAWRIRAGAFAKDEMYGTVLADAGFVPVRRFWRMLLPLADWPGREPAAPPWVTYRAAATADDKILLHRLFCESFADHWGTTVDRPTDEWLANLEAGAGSDPSRWWLAYLDDEPAGVCILDDSLAEFGEGHVRTLGVVPAARGRGIARWLLQCAAADAVTRGRTGLALMVDGQNTTGATELYTSVGFVVRQVIDAWELQESPAGGPERG